MVLILGGTSQRDHLDPKYHCSASSYGQIDVKKFACESGRTRKELYSLVHYSWKAGPSYMTIYDRNRQQVPPEAGQWKLWNR